jgi:maltose alpha-D-glucosyltransferase/alpha-amylase
VQASLGGQVRENVRAMKIRHHGDYHLGQVLVAKNDFYIVDFEGEPLKPLEERRSKQSPLRDVAGMLRSFNYAGWSALTRATQNRPEDRPRLQRAIELWERETAGCFLAGYEAALQGSPAWTEDAATRRSLLDLLLLEKAAYEICYEAQNRPDWVHIPLRGVLALLAPATGDGHAA